MALDAQGRALLRNRGHTCRAAPNQGRESGKGSHSSISNDIVNLISNDIVNVEMRPPLTRSDRGT